ncbi:adenylate cyclase type 9 [Condylostylus longicornis]|uniref:adenylate cyclase type 9 n=1 Tax=Condylostylus longicornis TaxID=2530218 RepID=UPI00244DD005|nr:adenylate cyclase type 9 [Condylostylus longicornis]
MTESQRESISFSNMPPGVLENDSRNNSADDIQIALAPHIQSYLSQTGRRHSCCSVMLPVAFERAAEKSWLHPRFDSAVLEGQYQTSVYPQIRKRYKFALAYILLCSAVWFLYFTFYTSKLIGDHWISVTSSYAILFVFSIFGFYFTKTNFYRAHTDITSAVTAITLCLTSLLFLATTKEAFSPLGHFAICLEIILLIYTALPMRLWVSGLIGITYSVLFELLTYLIGAIPIHGGRMNQFCYKILILRILLQISVHLIGLHVLVMNIVRWRGTFMKVGQNLLVRRQLEMEKQLKEKMIHSVMPPKVANMLLKEGGANGLDDSTENNTETSYENFMRPRPSNDVKSLFRPFHMSSMDNVSILFADIVGFTKMSSTKTAEQLVEILNDLFERFDDLCNLNGCEKISTLGDCYYCVSGCPEPRPDHAICCVEMGIGMIEAMRCFDAQRGEGVKMRVGVHTGTVLCGIVGTRRVKFDVWSNDVTLANKMESTGKPEQVHISEETSSFLGDAYFLEEGEEVFGHRTYFVVGRRTSRNSSITPISKSECNHLTPDGYINGVVLSQSATNLSTVQPAVPPASPVGQISSSLNPSPVLSIRPRLTSFSMKIRKKSTANVTDSEKGSNNPQKPILPQQHPKIIITAKSLPGSLDSDHEPDDLGSNGETNGKSKNNSKPTLDGTGNGTENNNSAAKYAAKLKNWKVPKFLKKTENEINNKAQQNNSGNCLNKPKGTDEVINIDQNGYQQLPVLIETPRPRVHTLDIPSKALALSPHSAHNGRGSLTIKSPDGSCCSPGILAPPTGQSIFDDIIDVRSYISQSRSDISPFGRSGSYRSQCGRSGGGNSETSPLARQRSHTMAGRAESPTKRNSSCGVVGLNASGLGGVWPDGLSICPSATSRKDSGIKSNSRRSSIQQQIYALNQSTISQHRVSGYFTSSTSSLSNAPINPETLCDSQHFPSQFPTVSFQTPQQHQAENQPLSDPLAACLQQLRKQSDLQLIRCVRDNAKSQRSYLVKPPLNKLTLFFKSRQMEREFRSKAHRFGSESESEGPPTLATPRYNTYIDIFVGIVVYFCISASLFLMTPTYDGGPETSSEYRIWASCFFTFTTIQIFALFLFTRQIRRRHSNSMKSRLMINNSKNSKTCADRLFESISSWYPWHTCLAILMSLPVILIVVNFTLLDLSKLEAFEYHYGFLIFVCIFHFCNFTQLNCWMRNFLALLAAFCFIGMAVGQLMVYSSRIEELNERNLNQSAVEIVSPHLYEDIKWFQNYHVEIYLDLVLLLILVWILNREFEIGYRLTFYGNAVANQDKIRVQNMKNQADMLLHNIIPKHVAEQLKNTAKYSENHHNIGIIFASIVNFNEMYDETYLGGKEYLRVLNELIADFDELLSRSEFKSVEKIKTIGSTFMAASGLDPSNRGDNDEHIITLMEFSLAMLSVVDAFNKDLLEFNLILRIGFNVGDVTAGVIGTSKLHYDIWGDAVNVASRMDSTGVAGRIQIRKECLQYLDNNYEFEPRGKVYVKGKDNMEVYLFKCKKPDQIDSDDVNIMC